jgi:hypothetical protein
MSLAWKLFLSYLYFTRTQTAVSQIAEIGGLEGNLEPFYGWNESAANNR